MSTAEERQSAVVVDTVPKRCPFVLLGLKKALQAAAEGQLLAVRTIDPQAIEDIRAYCQAAALRFEGTETADKLITIYVKKAAIQPGGGQ